jgi:hypothetical protein
MVQLYDWPVDMGWYNVMRLAVRYGMAQFYDWPVDMRWYNLTTGRSIRDGTMLRHTIQSKYLLDTQII